MGEVYRALGTTLGRGVAMDPAREFTTDPERMSRFERGRILASLDHRIGAIYGVEASDGGRALVVG